MDRLKFNNVPHPEEILSQEELSQLIGDEQLSLSDGHNLDGIAMTLYIDEMKKLQKMQPDNFSEIQKTVAKGYLRYLLQSRLVKNITEKEKIEEILVSNITQFKEQLDTLEKEIENLGSRLETINHNLQEQKHKSQANNVMMGESDITTLHFDDIHHLKGELRQAAENYNRFLKARTTDEINEKYKLADKSLGYRYLILLGEKQIDLQGHKTR